MALPENFMTPEAYLKFERASETKHEYFGGEVFAMSGASSNHSTISGNAFAALHLQLRSQSCRVYQNDMRVRTPSMLYTYPDISVVCGEPRFDDKAFDTLINPTLIIEVLSPSTERYDRGRKFQHYRTIETLQEYVLIAQDNPRIERYLRQPNDEWLLTDIQGLDAVLELPSIQCRLVFADTYELIRFEDSEI